MGQRTAEKKVGNSNSVLEVCVGAASGCQVLPGCDQVLPGGDQVLLGVTRCCQV